MLEFAYTGEVNSENRQIYKHYHYLINIDITLIVHQVCKEEYQVGKREMTGYKIPSPLPSTIKFVHCVGKKIKLKNIWKGE